LTNTAAASDASGHTRSHHDILHGISVLAYEVVRLL
jgi:hypothetical protein